MTRFDDNLSAVMTRFHRGIQSSVPQALFESARATEYWIARSSRAMTESREQVI